MASFYEHISTSKSRRNQLITLYIIGAIILSLAIALIIGLVNYFFFEYLQDVDPIDAQPIFTNWIFYFSAIITILIVIVILIGSLNYKYSDIKKGASYFVKNTGAVPIKDVAIYLKNLPNENSELTDFQQSNLKHLNSNDLQRLSNVIQEMAVASCTAMPEIFIDLRCQDINAFSAGITPNDSAICVTVGTLKKLNRTELQGVIAHEFSHICNGDIRNSMYAICLIYSMGIIFTIGYFIMKEFSSSGGSSNSKSSKGLFYFVVLGFIIMALGYIGKIFSCIMQRAVLRKAEYLADATAVKYTRNPFGLMNALNKASIANKEKNEESLDDESYLQHLYFTAMGDTWFPSHPPIQKRIAAISTIAHGLPETADKIYSFSEDELVEDINEPEKYTPQSIYDFYNFIKINADNSQANKAPTNKLNKLKDIASKAILAFAYNQDVFEKTAAKIEFNLKSLQFADFDFEKRSAAILDLINLYRNGANSTKNKIKGFIFAAKLPKLNAMLLEVALYTSTPPQDYDVKQSLYNNAVAAIYSYVISQGKLNSPEEANIAFIKATEAAGVTDCEYQPSISVNQLKEQLKFIRYNQTCFKEDFFKGLQEAINADKQHSDIDKLFLLFTKAIEPSLEVNNIELEASESATPSMSFEGDFNTIAGDFVGSVIDANTAKTLISQNNCKLSVFLKEYPNTPILEDLEAKLVKFSYALKKATAADKEELLTLLKEIEKDNHNCTMASLMQIVLKPSKFANKNVSLSVFHRNARTIYSYIAQNSELNQGLSPQAILDLALEEAELPHAKFAEEINYSVQQAFIFMQSVNLKFKNRFMLGLESAIKADGNISTEEEIILVFSRYLLNN